MKSLNLRILKKKLEPYDWKLLLFLVLVMNVKLVVKVLALLLMTLLERKNISLENMARQPYLFFYFGMMAITLINLLLQIKTIPANYLPAVALGIFLWSISALAAYHLFRIVQKQDIKKLHATVCLFFLSHIAIIFFNLLLIMFKTGSINPYTYRGLNQKYYISTGDFISGITFDSPVTTAFICAFGILYFLFRRQFLFSIMAMASLLLIGSNLTNIFMIGIFVTTFLLRTDRYQKSLVVVYCCMLIIFLAKISPQNNEYVISFVYKMIGKPYYLPPIKNILPEALKKMPDHLLTFEQQRKKTSLLYIDSISAAMNPEKTVAENKRSQIDSFAKNTVVAKRNKQFYEYRPGADILEKENENGLLLQSMFTPGERDSLQQLYDWEKPGKWIAYRQLTDFFQKHPIKVLTGTGIGNFSSRLAFKATALGMAGSYPEKYAYIHPLFRSHYFYLYLQYHSQKQARHTAANTPDSVYSQLLGEYGMAGVFIFIFFYTGYFIRHRRLRGVGLPMLLLLLGAFLIEYVFEQLSIVLLFELLMFLNMKTLLKEEQKV